MRSPTVKYHATTQSRLAIDVVAWIFLSVLASLLTSSLQAVGAEHAEASERDKKSAVNVIDSISPTARSNTGRHWQGIWHAIQEHQTQWGIAVGGLDTLARLERDSRMQPVWESTILKESNRLVAQSISNAPSPIRVQANAATNPDSVKDSQPNARLASSKSVAAPTPEQVQRRQLGSIFASLADSTDEGIVPRFQKQIEQNWMMREARAIPIPGLTRLVSFHAKSFFEPVIVEDFRDTTIAAADPETDRGIELKRTSPKVMTVDDAIVLGTRPLAMQGTSKSTTGAGPIDAEPIEREVRLQPRTTADQTQASLTSIEPIAVAKLPRQVVSSRKQTTELPIIRLPDDRRNQAKLSSDRQVMPVGLPLVTADAKDDEAVKQVLDQPNSEIELVQPAPVAQDNRIAQQWPLSLITADGDDEGIQQKPSRLPDRAGRSRQPINLQLRETDVRTVFDMLARSYKMNLLVAPDVDGTITATMNGVEPREALDGILRMANLRAVEDRSMIYIYPADNLPPEARKLRTFPLGPGQAAMLEATVQGLLSPVGNAYITSLGQDENHDNRDAIVVVDVPENVETIELFIREHTDSHSPVEGRELRMFPLDFARGEVLDPMVKGLLSPTGNSYIASLDAADNLKTREAIVVVDIPSRIDEIESFILQADQPPRQVMVEARVLEVVLSDDLAHGVDLTGLLRGELTIGSRGMTVPGLSDSIFAPRDPTFFASIGGERINALVDLLEQTVDAKTLATPSVTVVNGQKASLLVGNELGYPVTTVTLNATTQTIEFLKVGVSLEIQPTISRDNKVMLRVRPEVSTGEIDFTTQTPVPSKGTRQVETSVLLNNHEGMVIGGLIEEKDSTEIRKLPWLGDLKYVGKLFQNRNIERSRTEIIVTLVPHIIENGCNTIPDCVDCGEEALRYERTVAPLLHGPLHQNCRPYEPRLPDSTGATKHLDVDEVNRMLP